MSYFQDWLSVSFKPCTLVYCTEKAKKIIAQNNLSPAEFLRPFGDFRGKKIQIQFNDKEKEPIAINNFILDFYDNDKFKQVDRESILGYIKTMLKVNEPIWNLSSPLITNGHVEPFMNRLKHYSTPWFREFEKTILECLHFDEYELYQQPLINIFICSIEEKTSVINDNLCKQIPKLIFDKRYESSKESIVITLNDCKDHHLKKEELEKCKSRFASMFKNYYIFNWDINNPPYSEPTEGEQKKISENFKKYFHRLDIYNKEDDKYKDYKKKEYGMYINSESYKKYKEEFMNYFTNVYINKVLERISSCNEIIKKNTGLLKMFKRSNDISYYHKSKVYKFTELERAYYNLGLLYFFFHNYDMANENFKQLRNYLKDKSEKHKERVKEIKAMCKFLQKKEAKKEFSIMDEMNVKGTNEQLMRTQIIIIKMMESKIKAGNKDYKMIIDTLNQFLKRTLNLSKKISSSSSLEFFYSLLQEKIGVYYLIDNKFRKFVYYTAQAGRSFSKSSPQVKNYALYCLSNLVYFIDNPSPSFINLRIYFNKLIGEVCNSLKYPEGSLKFYKNCLEFSSLPETIVKETQNSYLMYYLSILTQIKREKIICNNIDLNDLNIPQVDNASLFVLENDDYNIKEKAKKMLGTDDKSWLVFNKYGESLVTDVYANLDESDLEHIKLIHDLTNQTNKVIANVHTDRYFYGNVGQKLFLKCTIKNPLCVEIQLSSVKLFCQFIPNKSAAATTQSQINIKSNLNINEKIEKNNKEENNTEKGDEEKNKKEETNTEKGDEEKNKKEETNTEKGDEEKNNKGETNTEKGDEEKNNKGETNPEKGDEEKNNKEETNIEKNNEKINIENNNEQNNNEDNNEQINTDNNNENIIITTNNENSQNQINEGNTNAGDNRNSLEKNININDKINNTENNKIINNVNIKTRVSEGKEQEQEQDIQQNLQYHFSEESYNMKPGETIELELNVSSPLEGKIIVKGLEFLLFNECKIIHLFSKKTTPSLYYYRNKKKVYSMGVTSHISSSSSSDYESRNSSELTTRNLNMNNIVIPRKNKIEYIISDFKNDLFVSFPMGTTVNVFLYQLFFFPIVVNNNSIQQRVRRYTIFIEDCNKNKVKTFFNFITKDNQIKQRFTSETVLIPIIPMATGKIYIKILIKFSGEMRVKPIPVKRFLIKLKVKESISFEVREYCSNLKVDKDGKTYNKMDFNIKTNLRIRNANEIKNLVMKEPLFNKELNLLNQKNYLITNNEIHKKFVFIKENVSNANNDNKYNLDFITNNINRQIEENENMNTIQSTIPIKRSSNNNFILDKFNKILNNPNGNIIFFPWEATHTIIEDENKKNKSKKDGNHCETPKDGNNTPSSSPKEEILQGLYPYKLKMENSEATKAFLTYLFNKYTELNITQKKIDKDKTMIKIILKLNKIGLASMGDKIEKYEIYANGIQSKIIWIGPKKFIVKNNLDENTFECRFNFITTLKGFIEINRISVLIYKKPDNPGGKMSTININHITKPTSVLIE